VTLELRSVFCRAVWSIRRVSASLFPEQFALLPWLGRFPSAVPFKEEVAARSPSGSTAARSDRSNFGSA
jgi:hypothetical protein